MEAPTALSRLIEAKLRDAGRLEGDSLHAWLQARRPDPGAKVSWDDIARDLWMLTNERVSGPSVAAWFATMEESRAGGQS